MVSPSQFLGFVSGFALDPNKTCEELKAAFGIPHVPTVDRPDELGLDYTETYVTNPAGYPLRVWYLPHPESRGVIVLSYGAVGELPCYLLFPLVLHREEGWSFVMYDFQGFGGSGGTPDLNSLSGDLGAVLDWTLANTGVEKVTLYGVSVGTIPSVAQAAARPDVVDRLVLDGLISLQVETERFAFLLGGRPARYYTQFDDTLLIQRQLPRVTQPILAVTYGLDEYATSAEVPELLAHSPAPSTILDFPHLAHARGPYLELERYFAAVADFLAQ